MKKSIRVLDKGLVRLEKHCADDMDVVRAARVSYGPKKPDAEKDAKLIAYMLRNEHGSPFEHTFFKFHIVAPIFVFRQWHRTRIGVSYNELSARYSKMKDRFYIPKRWRAQDVKNKQGSVKADLDHEGCREAALAHCKESMRVYDEMLRVGVAREMARMVLPVNLYSEMYFSANARSLMYFIALRSDKHAQAETRRYSHAMAYFFKKEMPWTWRAFDSYLRSRKDRDYSELFTYLKRTESRA